MNLEVITGNMLRAKRLELAEEERRIAENIAYAAQNKQSMGSNYWKRLQELRKTVRFLEAITHAS